MNEIEKIRVGIDKMLTRAAEKIAHIIIATVVLCLAAILVSFAQPIYVVGRIADIMGFLLFFEMGCLVMVVMVDSLIKTIFDSSIEIKEVAK